MYNVNKTVTETQINYTTGEKELQALVYAFDKFESYLIDTKAYTTQH